MALNIFTASAGRVGRFHGLRTKDLVNFPGWCRTHEWSTTRIQSGCCLQGALGRPMQLLAGIAPYLSLFHGVGFLALKRFYNLFYLSDVLLT